MCLLWARSGEPLDKSDRSPALKRVPGERRPPMAAQNGCFPLYQAPTVQVLRARSWEGATKELFAAVWKDEFVRQGIRVAILHQGTASVTRNGMGSSTG